MDSTSNINPCAKLIMAATAVLRKLNESQQSTSSQFGQKHFANLRIVSCNNHSTNRSPCSESFHLPANTFPDRGELRVPMSSLSKYEQSENRLSIFSDQVSLIKSNNFICNFHT